MYYYVKWKDGTYTECSFNKDGNLYILHEVVVQRGMGNQKANELLIQGIPKSKIQNWCIKNNCLIVGREDQVHKSQIRRLDK